MPSDSSPAAVKTHPDAINWTAAIFGTAVLGEFSMESLRADSRSEGPSKVDWASSSRLRATDELTEEELAEVVYHASGHAGFPAANTACTVAREVFDAEA
jgi:hypothetical protein